MQGSPVALIEGRSDPALHREDVTQGRPAVGDARGLEFHAQELNALVGEDGDEQMSVRAHFLSLIHI